MKSDAPPPAGRPSRWRGAAFGLAGFAVAIVLIAVYLRLSRTMGGYAQTLAVRGPGSAAAFAGLIAVAVVLLIPTGPLTLGAGAILGVRWGILAVLAGMTAGSGVSFLLGRTVLARRVHGFLGRRPRLRAVHAAVGREGPRLVLLIRLVPLFPSKLANYAFGTTDLRFLPYLAASLLGYIPNTLAAVQAGAIAAQAVGAGTGGRDWTVSEWIARCLGLTAVALFLLIAARRARTVPGLRSADSGSDADPP